MAGERALVLIPCSGRKRARASDLPPAPPVPGIEQVRDRVWPELGAAPSGRTVPAIDLYDGRLYSACASALAGIARTGHPAVDVLIVSALYGLVQLAEPIADYNVTMGTKTPTHERMDLLWQRYDISAVLERHVRDRGISRVWSLLSSSPPSSGYHQVFDPFWDATTVPCLHVRTPGVSMDAPRRRGTWLAAVIGHCPGHLTGTQPDIETVSPYLSFPVEYTGC